MTELMTRIRFEFRADGGAGPTDKTVEVTWPSVPRKDEYVELDEDEGWGGYVNSVLWRKDGSAIVRLR